MRDVLLAEFDASEKLERAWEELERQGYTRMTTWTPYAPKSIVRKLPESMVPYVMLAAGLFGGLFAYLLQWWCNAKSYPINVGGRPLNSAPAFIPIVFETTVLFASITGFLVTFGFSRLPRLYHPNFEVEGFDRATVDRYWLGIDATDPRFDERVVDALTRMGALRCVRREERP
jgi:hypothetical protein